MSTRPKTLFPFQSHLFLSLHGGSGNPYAMRLNIKKLTLVAIGLGSWLTVSFLGTLLFFREMELNRQLQDRLLEAENRDKLKESTINWMRSSSFRAAGERQSASVSSEMEPNAKSAALAVEPQAGVGARLGDISADCAGTECEVRLAMMPTTTGIAQGQLLVVLETEIPRIGTGNPSNQVRKRFYIYPGNQTRDELPPDQLVGLERKAFKFSRALQTTAAFSIGKLLRPLAVNVYLFDNQRVLIHHERKAIETEE